MIRKIIVFIALTLGAISASAVLPIDKYTVKRSDLPEAAREMLDEYFPKAKVSMIKVDRHLLKKTDSGLYNKKARDGIRTRGPHLGKVVLHP